MNDRTGELIRIAHDQIELSLGHGVSPLEQPGTALGKHGLNTWLQSICRFLSDINSRIELRDPRTVSLQRENDKHIMTLAAKGGFDLELIQQLHLYLQAVTIADIATAFGTRLEPWAVNGRGRKSRLNWPRQETPSTRARAEWHRFLKTLITTSEFESGLTLTTEYRLGAWHRTHQQWPWTGTNTIAISRTGEMYKIDHHTLVQLPPTTYPKHPLPIQITSYGQRYQRIRIPEHAAKLETAQQGHLLNIAPPPINA